MIVHETIFELLSNQEEKLIFFIKVVKIIIKASTIIIHITMSTIFIEFNESYGVSNSYLPVMNYNHLESENDH